jgi:phage baseplate assembly protein W
MAPPAIFNVRQFGETTAGAAEVVVNAGAAQNRTEWVLDPAFLPAFPAMHLYGVYSSSVPYTLRLRLNTDPTTAGAASGTIILELVLPAAVFPTAFVADVASLPTLLAITLLKLCHVGNGAKLDYASISILGNPPIAPLPSLARTDQVESGVDIDCILDVGRSLALAKGLRNLGNALARRLVTPRGGLFYDANYGLDVRAFVNAGFTAQQLAQVQADIAAEVSKDPRIENPQVTVVSNVQTGSMAITIVCELAEGPFQFLLAVTALTVELLSVEALS